MTLFPNLSDRFYVDNDRDILKMMEWVYAKNITINQSYWAEADTDARFKSGDQSVFADLYGSLPTFRRRQFSFNRIRRIINMISGYQRQHRKSTQVLPIENSDQKTADQFTKLLYHVNSRGHVLETISEAFEGAITCGMNLLSTWIDYRSDPVNGDIVVDNLSYNSFLIDPFFKKKDLSDCNNIWIRKYLAPNQVKSLLPGRESEISELRGTGNKDGKFQFLPESYNFSMSDLLIYDEFFYQTTRKQKMLVDTKTGETFEWRGRDEDLKDFLDFYDDVVTLDSEIPTVNMAVIVQGKVMYHGPNPMGIDRYPFVPIWAYYDPSISYYPNRVQGVTRGIRDAQYLYNRRKCVELDILESQVTSGFKYKENALVNPKDVFLSGQGRGLALKAEAQMSDVEQIQPPQIPPSMIQLSELLGQEIQQISGVNEELLGAAQDDKAGILSVLRQGAGLTTLQVLFDNVDQSQKLLGDIHVEMMQANWTPGKVLRIIAEEPSNQFYNRSFGKYDAIVEEAPLTATQKQLALQQALYLREIGVPIPSEYILENMQLPNKSELIEQISQTEQAQQQQAQKMQELQMQQLQVDNETKLSYAEAEKSLAAERMNKVHLDKAVAMERLNKAQEDKSSSTLNVIKTIKEIQEMDLNRLERALDLMARIEAGMELSEMGKSDLPHRIQDIQPGTKTMD